MDELPQNIKKNDLQPSVSDEKLKRHFDRFSEMIQIEKSISELRLKLQNLKDQESIDYPSLNVKEIKENNDKNIVPKNENKIQRNKIIIEKFTPNKLHFLKSKKLIKIELLLPDSLQEDIELLQNHNLQISSIKASIQLVRFNCQLCGLQNSKALVLYDTGLVYCNDCGRNWNTSESYIFSLLFKPKSNL
jgi:hypothetical protein